MSKRSDTIKSLFMVTPDVPLSSDNKPANRVASGPVRSMRESFSGIERENELLREKMATGAMVLEIDPALIDPSPVSDRFVDGDTASFEALKSSIGLRGQEVPVLVREHPEAPGRYQTAYGHRRIRAARDLGIAVRALVRAMSDQDLVVAQGVENSARQDLSFIERAIFAMRLEDAGHDRAVIQEALSIDRAEASKLVAVARSVPGDIVVAIGRAPKAGRGRWQALAAHLKQPALMRAVRREIGRKGFEALDSDQRFVRVLDATAGKARGPDEAARSVPIETGSGTVMARIDQSARETRITLDGTGDPAFAAYLIERLPELFEAFRKDRPR